LGATISSTNPVFLVLDIFAANLHQLRT
jgi:hypothetical protein